MLGDIGIMEGCGGEGFIGSVLVDGRRRLTRLDGEEVVFLRCEKVLWRCMVLMICFLLRLLFS